LLYGSCGRRAVSSPRRTLSTSCSRTCGLTWARWPPLLPGAKLSEDRGLGSAIRDESLGARHPTLPGLEHRSLQEKRRVATHALNVCVPSRTAGVA
jgi:hypothetical protein